MPEGTWKADKRGFLHCSRCSYELSPFLNKVPFCPNCGASIQNSDGVAEMWRDIPGKWYGYYQASNLGRIRSLDRDVTLTYSHNGVEELRTRHIVGKILATNKTAGYLGVVTSIEGEISYPNVHTLVALAFVPNPDNKPQVDHIDGDTTNNKASNLRWVTSKENHANAMRHGSHTCQIENPYRRKPIQDVDTGEIFDSMLDAEKKYNIPKGRISAAIKSDQRVYGHKFQLVEISTHKLF